MKPLHTLTAVEASGLLKLKEITAEELVRSCLDRIQAREPVVHAWQYLNAEAALSAARELDRGPWRGLLHGIPVGIKDLFDTHDMPTAYGSPIYKNHRPAMDAQAVGLIRKQGGIVLGKTVTTEFASFFPGETTNPWNPGHTPGGSSSGSAAAVADTMVPLALGTQTAGSIIRPAAFCGVIAYKPSFGKVDRTGIKPFADSLDTAGVFARTVDDAAFLATALMGREAEHLELVEKKPMRVGVCKTYEWPQAAAETHTAITHAASLLTDHGCVVKEVTLPPLFSELTAAQADIMAVEGARHLAWERQHCREQISHQLLELLEAGAAISKNRYKQAQEQVQQGRMLLGQVFADTDLILAPSTVGEAPAGLASTGNPVFARMWTALHVPAIHLPFTKGPHGLPVGLQCIAPGLADAMLLSYAKWILNRLLAPQNRF